MRASFTVNSHSFITKSCVDKLRFQTTPCRLKITTMSGDLNVTESVTVQILSNDGITTWMDVPCYVTPSIDMMTSSRNFDMRNLTDYVDGNFLTDDFLQSPIEIQLGSDVSYRCLDGGHEDFPNGLTRYNSVFNDVICGTFIDRYVR